jgi:hypothetical protein
MSISTYVRKLMLLQLVTSAQNVLHDIQCTTHHGPPHPFKDAGAVADSLTDIHSEMERLFVVNRRCTHNTLHTRRPTYNHSINIRS